MLKIYKFSVKRTTFALIPVFCLGIIIVLVAEEWFYRILGILLIFIMLSLLFWWISATKEGIIRIDEESITFTLPAFAIHGKSQKRILWKDVVAVYTRHGHGDLSPTTYLVTTTPLGKEVLDSNLVRSIVQRGKESKEARKYFDYLIVKQYVIKIPSQIENYHDAIKEICNRATNAIIDKETRKRTEGKESLIIFSDETKRALRKIFRRNEQPIKPIFPEKYDGLKEKRKKPLNPHWLVPISIFFTFPIAGIIMSFNYDWLDKPGKKRKNLYVFLGIVVILAVVSIIFPYPLQEIFGLIFWFDVLGGITLTLIQLPDYTEWKLKNEFKQEV